MRCASGLGLVLLMWLSGCALVPMERSATSSSAQKPAPSSAKLVEEPVSPELQRAYAQALAHIQAGRNKEAEQALLALAQRAPELSGPHTNLGILYGRAGRTKEAIEALNRAVRLNPRHAAYYNELGILYRQEGKFDEARRQYLRAIETDPDYALAQRNIAILYDLYLQDPKQALPHYQRYQQLLPKEDSMVTKWIIDLERRTRPADPKSSKEKS